MTIEELKSHVRFMLSAALPFATVQIEPVGDDPRDLVVSVFGVAPNAVKWARDLILDVDEAFCSNTAFVITPLVRDKETTRKFYPQFLSPWTARVDLGELYQPKLLVESQTEYAFAISEPSNAPWESAGHSENYGDAANEELALAA
jgi:hypothetical protein